MGRVHHRTSKDYGRFAEAWTALLLARLIVSLLPFRAIATLASWQGAGSGQAMDEAALSNAVVTAVRRASKRLPIRCVCIHEGLAAQWMLRRRGIPAYFHYGIRQADNRLAAHVWVSLGDEVLIGMEEAGGHACVATFPENVR